VFENIILTLQSALDKPLILDFVGSSYFAKFNCLKGCTECCGYTYFLPNEYRLLKNQEIKKQLIKNQQGIYEAKKVEGRCIFCNIQNEEYYCKIHEFRPLRCRIYPYFPLIVEGKIIITLEPALKMKHHSSKANTNCPGIGISGKSLQQSISDCLEYLKSLASAPDILKTIILDNETFQKIRDDRWFINHNFSV